MNFVQTVILGAIAGFTIYLGLPVGMIRTLSNKVRSFLSMASVGILFFLFYDIFGHLSEPIEDALHQGTVAESLPLLVILVVGLGAGLLGLIAFEHYAIRARPGGAEALSPIRLAFMIAGGIGLHNFSEGLAIGQSAAGGELAFATVLIIGFGLHNATEGFGIMGPLVGGERPSWGFVGLAGLIAGGPTFLGTIAGYYFASPTLSVLFLALAAGALIYIIGELLHVNWRQGVKFAAGAGLFAGLLIAYMTDLILDLAGG